MAFRILYQDPYLVAIDKPSGFHVHPPEDTAHRVSRNVNCLFLLRKQLNTYLYPVHRLDRATSGVLIFALQSDTARELARGFQQQEMKKTYFCVTRGWAPEQGTITQSLQADTEAKNLLEASTTYSRLGTIELPHAVGRYPSARYSLLRVEPHTGRKHQIRRHMNHMSYPLIGDTVYGSGEHNRFFREKLQIQGLLLKAYSLEFKHPHTGELMKFSTRWNGLWHQVFELFGLCPFESHSRVLPHVAD
jgi:tRNA pseudouridine65 synthase